MAQRSDDIKKQVNELLKQAIDQLETLKDALVRSRGRFEADLARLRLERDRLLRLLGEQTYRLANQGKLPMPGIVKSTVDRLNHVIDNIVAKQGTTKKKAKKKAAKKKTTKKAAKKSTTRRKSGTSQPSAS